MRGSGKTVVGEALAARLSWPRVDTDEVIEKQADASIAEIFAAEGEAGFRKREREVVAALAPTTPTIVSVGGGAVLDSNNRCHLARIGNVAWLYSSVSVLWQRVSADRRSAAMRPALLAGGGRDELEALLEAREPLYRAVAERTVDTSRLTPAEAAEIIAEWLRSLSDA